jgi:hypothetical protein
VLAAVGTLLLTASAVLFLERGPTGAGSRQLDFDRVDVDEFGVGGHMYPQTEPKLVIITRPEEVDELGNEVMRRALPILRELDYGQFFAVAVFQGQQPETSYSVDTRHITQNGQLIVIETIFHTPVPGFERSPLHTSPYQIVTVEKPLNPGQDFEFVLRVAGASVITLTHFIP